MNVPTDPFDVGAVAMKVCAPAASAEPDFEPEENDRSAFPIAAAVSRGLLDYEDPVAKHWPEFAANGKQDVTVRQLIDHQHEISIEVF